MSTAARTTTIRVPDMHCAACSGKVRRALERGDGVIDLRFNPVRRQVLVDHREDVTSGTLLQWIEQAGFHPMLAGTEAVASDGSRDLLIRLGVAGFCMMQVMMVTVALYAGAFEGIDEAWRRILEFSALLFTIPVITYSAAPFFRTALDRSRGLGMDATIALAIAVAFAVSLWNTLSDQGEVYYDAVTMFAALMLGTRYLDARLRDRLLANDRLSDALPRRVVRIGAAGPEDISAAFVQSGDILFVREGEMLCVDGTLLRGSGSHGHAQLEESSLTGESDWRTAQAGERLYAGTWNRGPAFEMRADGHMDASRIARIDALTESAMTSKGRLASMTDRIAALFVPAILLLSTIAALFWWFVDPGRAIPAALAVLVVSCPCALALAAPAALHATVSRLKQAGILIRDANAIERLAAIDQVTFDKTGTLTLPTPRIEHIDLQPGYSREQVLRLAGALQQQVSHPLARAFPAANESATEVVVIPGQGVSGQVSGHRVVMGTAALCGVAEGSAAGNRIVWMSIDGRPAAAFRLFDALRPDAGATIGVLRQLGFTVTMESGDRNDHCAHIAAELGIAYNASRSPEDKAAFTAARADTTLFVGDGLNDMPALATSAVSVAMLETSDLVKSKADAILLQPRLGALVDLMVIGRASRRIVRQNLAWAGLYNLIAIPLAMAAIAPPWAAALGMSLSSLIVLANAMRILRVSPAPLPDRLEV